MDIDCKCRCGSLVGVARATEKSTNIRVLCHCKYCVGFARHLGAETTLVRGGADILPIAPAFFVITRGREHLRVLKLTPKGPLRFYAGCCKTPVANAASLKFPYIGLIAPFCPNEKVGPVVTEFGGDKGSIRPKFLFGVMGFMAKNVLLGRGKPSALFEPDGQPCAPPELVTQP